ncbi:4284_t:CDS:1, partial [Racocetra persica]
NLTASLIDDVSSITMNEESFVTIYEEMVPSANEALSVTVPGKINQLREYLIQKSVYLLKN